MSATCLITGATGFVGSWLVKRLLAAHAQIITLVLDADPQSELIRSGDIVFEPCPQGIVVERLRAGAAGIPAFYSPVGVDTVVAGGKLSTPGCW